MGVLVYLITKPLMQYVAILLLQPCSNFKKMLGSQKILQFLAQFSTFLWSYLCLYNTHALANTFSRFHKRKVFKYIHILKPQ